MLKSHLSCASMCFLAMCLARPLSAGECSGLSKSVPSPDRKYLAFTDSCLPKQAAGRFEFVVSDESGKDVSRTAIAPKRRAGEDCESPRVAAWLDPRQVGLICQYDPSLKDYLVVEIPSGRVEQEYSGLEFCWSPDRRNIAQVGVLQTFESPVGRHDCLQFNGVSTYPAGCTFEGQAAPPKSKRGQPHPDRHPFREIHFFSLPPVWSPDSRRVALLEKIFDWEYEDPYNRYFGGTESNVRYYLAILSPNQPAVGYPLHRIPAKPLVQWTDATGIMIDGQSFNLATQPPVSIP